MAFGLAKVFNSQGVTDLLNGKQGDSKVFSDAILILSEWAHHLIINHGKRLKEGLIAYIRTRLAELLSILLG